MRFSKSALLAIALIATLHAATPQTEPAQLDEVVVTSKVPLSIDAFIAHAKYDSVVISPGGTRLAMGWTEDDFRRQLTVVEFPSMKSIDSQFLRTHFGVTDLRWVGERRLIVQAEWPGYGFRRHRLFLGSMLIKDLDADSMQVLNDFPAAELDPLGMQVREEELAMQALAQRQQEALAQSQQEAIVKSKQAKASKGAAKPADVPVEPAEPIVPVEPVALDAQGPVRLVTARTGQPDQILIQTIRTSLGDSTNGYGVFLMNLQDSTQSRVAMLPLRGAQFITGPDNRIALATAVNEQNERVVYYLPGDLRAEGKDWQLVVTSPATRGLVPVAWTGSGEEYYALDGRGSSTRSVVIWNAATNTQRELYRNLATDMDAVALDPAGKPWMFSGMERYPVYWYPDFGHPLALLHKKLVQQLPREYIEVLNASNDLGTAVVRLSSGRRAPVYHIIDVKTLKSLGALTAYPKLKGTRLAPVEAIEFRARDGLMIHGYLTTPLDENAKPRPRAPLLVIAHDGPEGGVTDYRYEFERQLFASRGYAVLQVNHRGTGGRGVDFERAGDHQWGREVQDDFADGVRWAIKEGKADASHVCFYGTGYGAYSALTTVARDPNLYDCVIGVGGVYDLPAMLGDGEREIPPALQQVLGSDMEELKDRSPVANAKGIKAKVMLMQYRSDRKVPVEQSSLMRSALRAAGNSPKWEPIDLDGGGGYFTPANRVDIYKRILRFLDERLAK